MLIAGSLVVQENFSVHWQGKGGKDKGISQDDALALGMNVELIMECGWLSQEGDSQIVF